MLVGEQRNKAKKREKVEGWAETVERKRRVTVKKTLPLSSFDPKMLHI